MKLELSSLENAVAALEKSIAAIAAHGAAIPEVLKDTIRSGVIQNFEVAYEQCWKMMKRWLENNVNAESVDGVTRRELFRLAAESQLIADVDVWMRFHTARNATSHTYDCSAAAEVEAAAYAFLESAQCFLKRIREKND